MHAVTVPEAGAFLQFWLIVAFLLGIAVNVLTVVKVTRSQKREVSFTFIPASKEEFDRHVIANTRDHENIFSRLNSMDKGCAQRMQDMNNLVQSRIDSRLDLMVKEDRESRTKIHDRINEVLAAVCRLEGEVNGKLKK